MGAALAGLYLAVGLAQGAAPQPVVEAAATTHDHQRLLVAYSTAPASPRPAAVIRQNVEAPADGFKSVSFKRSTDLKRGGELDCLTKAVYFEARGETPAGQAAVAQVVLNRVRHPAFPKSVCAVVFQGAGKRIGCQFSFACDGSMRRGRETAAWNRAQKVASRALSGTVMAVVGNATHFHTVNVAPSWGPRLVRTAEVGLHVFYRFGQGASRMYAAAPDSQRATFTSAPGVSAPMEITTELRLTSAVKTDKPDATAVADTGVHADVLAKAPSPTLAPAEAAASARKTAEPAKLSPVKLTPAKFSASSDLETQMVGTD